MIVDKTQFNSLVTTLKKQIYTTDLNVRIAIVDDIADLVALDNAVFGVHQSVSEIELKEVISKGFILVVETKQGQIVGQSQVLLKSSNILNYPLKDFQAFAFGTGIINSYQGNGIGSILRKGQILIAKEFGKEQVLATCRLENYYSLKSLFKLGYFGNKLYKNYYGSLESGGGRISVCNDIYKELLTSNEANNISIEFEGPINIKTYSLVQKMFDENFILVGVDREKGNLFNGQLIFKKKK